MMNYNFDIQLASRYHSNAQKIRVMSEGWLENNMYCPCCGNPHIKKLPNNKPVSDFLCESCKEIFELKSKKGSIGKKIVDGAYRTMISRINSIDNPDLFILSYSSQLQVTDLFLIPKFFFVPDIIEKRTPLKSDARRAGWEGCSILFSEIPIQGRISIINHQDEIEKNSVITCYQKIYQLKTDSIEQRGWLFDVLNCINKIPNNDFYLSDLYKFVPRLKLKYSDNHNIEAKIRQQLQILRDKKIIEFLDRGHYKKI